MAALQKLVELPRRWSELPAGARLSALGLPLAAGALLGFLGWMGAFRSPRFQAAELPELSLIWIPHVGNYDRSLGTGFALAKKLRDQLVQRHQLDQPPAQQPQQANEQQEDQQEQPPEADQLQVVGVYLDDPNRTPAGQLRAAIGLALPTPLARRLFQDAADLAQYGEEFAGFRLTELPGVQAQRAEFPLRNFLSLPLGTYKIYSGAYKHLEPETIGASLERYQASLTEYWVLPPQLPNGRQLGELFQGWPAVPAVAPKVVED